jgi:hypothetical protein
VKTHHVVFQPRQHWAYAVVKDGRTVARCDSYDDALKVAKAMNTYNPCEKP